MLLAELTPDTSRAPAAEAAGKMKQFASWFTHGVRGGAALRKSIYEAKTGAAILEAVDRFFSTEAANIPDQPDEAELIPANAAPEVWD
jgi:tRNA-dihydrouridine synthase